MLKIIFKAFSVFVGVGCFGGIFGSMNIFIGENLRLGWGGWFFTFIAILIGVIIGFILVNRLLHYHGSLLLGVVGSTIGLGASVLFLGRFFTQILNDLGLVGLGGTYAWFAVHALVAALLGTLGFLLGRLIPQMPSTPKGVQNDNCTKQNNGS